MTDIWFCKIGENCGELPPGADLPMRNAVAAAYEQLTGVEPSFIFSGWCEKLPERSPMTVDAAPIFRAAVEEIERLKYALAEKDRDETERELVRMGRRIAELEKDVICSIHRDPGGDAALDIYIDAQNNLSISVHRSGRIAWTGCVNGSRNHNTVTHTVLGNYLFTLLGVALAAKGEK